MTTKWFEVDINFQTLNEALVDIGYDGYSLRDAEELIGNYIEHPASWRHGTDMSSLSGRPVRLHFVMKDANLYSLQFRP